ncbi:hypothetical protein RRG08_066608 [Elysia crispata]|uniref:Uncharacterized protein n=1 Tax=Elysia crispata TaxID=231223 RepID=A0AAE1D862_9GAST|nr:hypothetical protein RRG08_066608 [Elysia crispata]
MSTIFSPSAPVFSAENLCLVYLWYVPLLTMANQNYLLESVSEEIARLYYLYSDIAYTPTASIESNACNTELQKLFSVLKAMSKCDVHVNHSRGDLKTPNSSRSRLRRNPTPLANTFLARIRSENLADCQTAALSVGVSGV